MTNITIQSNDGKTYSIVASKDDGGWYANIAEIAQDGGLLREVMSEDEFAGEWGAATSEQAALQWAAGSVIF